MYKVVELENEIGLEQWNRRPGRDSRSRETCAKALRIQPPSPRAWVDNDLTQHARPLSGFLRNAGRLHEGSQGGS